MAAPNRLLTASSYTLASAATSGASAVISAVLSSPGNLLNPGGRVMVTVENTTSLQGVEVEGRIVFTDLGGTEQAVPMFVTPLSLTLITLGAGIEAALVYDGVGGSAFQVAIMAGSTLTSAISGTCTIWAL
jgi:hypothetical protein